MKSISVFITNWNYGCFLDRCLKSVFNQTRKPKEVVIVDDASIDNSWDVLRKYSSTDKIRFQPIIHSAQQGAVKSLNEGLSRCTGDYIIRLDADDWWHKRMLEETGAILDDNEDVSFAYTDVYHDGKLVRVEEFDKFPDVVKNNVGNFIRSSFLFREEAKNEFIEDNHEDWYFLLMMYFNKRKGKRVPEPLLNVGRHPEMGHRENLTDEKARGEWLIKKGFKEGAYED